MIYLQSNIFFLLSCHVLLTVAVRRLDRLPLKQQRKLERELYPALDERSSLDNTSNGVRRGKSIPLPKPEDHLVTSLPYLATGSFPTKHYAGHLPASDGEDKKIFYWLFEPDDTQSETSTDDKDIPLLIWLNGGPGCSSMDGLFIENGPFNLEPGSGDDWNITINPHSWHNSPAYLLYIDQPVGTGLSFTRKKNFCKNDLEINIDFYFFLQSFLTVYSDTFLVDKGIHRSMKRPLYFSGESHAGHYIPSMMDYILQQNDNINTNTTDGIKIDLGGAAIGNGWIDPYHQYAVSDYAYSIGLIDAAERQGFSSQEHICHEKLLDGNLDSRECRDLYGKVVSQGFGTGSLSVVSGYDTRKWEKNGGARLFPPGYTDVEAYLGGWRGSRYPSMDVQYKDVLKALHALESVDAKQRYKECTDPPYFALMHQDGLGVVPELVRLLEHRDKPRMLFFNGMADLVCHHMGNELLLLNLPWQYNKEWTVADRYAWYDSDSSSLPPAGYMKEFDNLMFLKIRDSGHMVPLDLPVVSLHMMRTFLYNASFESKKQLMKSEIPNGVGEAFFAEAFDNSSGLFGKLTTFISFFVGLVTAWVFHKMFQRHPKAAGSPETELSTHIVGGYKDEPNTDIRKKPESSQDYQTSIGLIS